MAAAASRVSAAFVPPAAAAYNDDDVRAFAAAVVGGFVVAAVHLGLLLLLLRLLLPLLLLLGMALHCGATEAAKCEGFCVSGFVWAPACMHAADSIGCCCYSEGLVAAAARSFVLPVQAAAPL